MNSTSDRVRGFTLVELLVVIAIIGILVALLLPAIQAAREAARRSHCQNNLKQMILAVHNYDSAKKEWPTGGFIADPNYNSGVAGKPLKGQPHQMGMQARILPYIEEQTLYDRIDWDIEYLANIHLSLNPVEMYLCPSNKAKTGVYPTSFIPKDDVTGHRTYTTHYHGVGGPLANAEDTPEQHWQQFWNKPGVVHIDMTKYPTPTSVQNFCSQRGGFSILGVFYPNSKVKFSQITDGTSQTLAIGERSSGETSFLAGISHQRAWACDAAGFKNVVYGINSCIDPGDEKVGANAQDCKHGNSNPFASFHPGGAHFALCDGAVTFLSESMDLVPLQAMSTRAWNDRVQQ